jgi:tRNA(Ile)-lysidine synthase
MAFHPFESRLAASWPPEQWKDLTALVAVSGGGDSVALLRGLEAIRLPGEGRLIAAHVNHKLRGADSEADQQFVEAICRERGIPCEVTTAAIDGTGSGQGQGLEAAARRARYAALEEMAGRLGARFVVTAHTADDQAETILHRIVRGTGLHGLGGIARARPLGPATLLRPLLEIRRAELAAYLSEIGQSCRTDSSNSDMRFTRNRIRNELLPLLAAQYNHTITDALLQLGQLARESQESIDTIVEKIAESCLRQIAPGEVGLDIDILARQPRHVVRELLMEVWRRQDWPLADMGFAEWELLADMISPQSQPCTTERQKRQFPGAVFAEIDGGELRLSTDRSSRLSFGDPAH